MRVLAILLVIGFAYGFDDVTVSEYLQNNGYTTLYSVLNTTGLTAALAGDGPFTIFAPTDAAFQALGTGPINDLVSNPDALKDVLLYHVIPEFLVVPMVSGSVAKTTLNGQDMTIGASGNSLVINNVSLVDPTNNDIIVNNGVVQPIDKVLLPPVMATNNIAQIILLDDTRFKDLFLALLLADLVKALETGEYTVFAPVDSAFAPFKDNLLDPSSPGAQTLYQEVLKYHVVPGARRANQLRDGQKLFTLHGLPLNVTVTTRGVLINNANVIDADLLATNGVVHAIDRLLVPSDLQTPTSG